MEDAARHPSEFGRLVTRIREARGYSQALVSQIGHLSDGYLSMIETGARGRNPRRDLVLKIAKGLRATDDERDELLRLAGHPVETGLPATATVVEAINTDPQLRADQKRVLLDLYATMLR